MATISVGCSGVAAAPVTPTATPVPSIAATDEEPVAASTATITLAAVTELAGMYGWDPEGGFHNAELEGTLAIEDGCAYVDVHRKGKAVTAPGGERLRSFVYFPEPRTRFVPLTGAIWVNGNGPMHSGDKVELIGSEAFDRLSMFLNNGGTEEFAMNERGHGCPAHISFWAASMQPAGTIDANEPIAAQLPGLGLFKWDPAVGTHDAGAHEGLLMIEPPCVYFETIADAAYDAVENDIEPDRFFLRLVRHGARYDSESGTLWYFNHAFSSGDRVEIAGGGAYQSDHEQLYRAHGCSAGGDGRTSVYTGIYMLPAGTGSWLSPSQ